MASIPHDPDPILHGESNAVIREVIGYKGEVVEPKNPKFSKLLRFSTGFQAPKHARIASIPHVLDAVFDGESNGTIAETIGRKGKKFCG